MSASKKWVLLPHDTDRCNNLAKQTKLSPVIAQLLINRGIDSPENAHRFLNPVLKGLHDPASLPGNLEAATLILNALKTGKVICIYGDYDADGISGTAILVRLLRILGGSPRFYVPKRLKRATVLILKHFNRLRAQVFSKSSPLIVVLQVSKKPRLLNP